MPGLFRVLHGTPSSHGADDSGSDHDSNFTILSPASLQSVWKHLDAGNYRTFKAFVGDVRRLFAYGYQLPLMTDNDSWRIQVAESWFDSALICAAQTSRCKPHRVPRAPPAHWPGSSSQLLATLSPGCANRSADLAQIITQLVDSCGAATPAVAPAE
jgi:hypothetical protein